MVRGWKFRIENVEELYYPCSENKGTDTDLCLCFRLCRLLAFPCGGSNRKSYIHLNRNSGHDYVKRTRSLVKDLMEFLLFLQNHVHSYFCYRDYEKLSFCKRFSYF